MNKEDYPHRIWVLGNVATPKSGIYNTEEEFSKAHGFVEYVRADLANTWISVDDNLPTSAATCFVRFNEFNHGMDRGIGYYLDKEWRDALSQRPFSKCNLKVTHWKEIHEL